MLKAYLKIPAWDKYLRFAAFEPQTAVVLQNFRCAKIGNFCINNTFPRFNFPYLQKMLLKLYQFYLNFQSTKLKVETIKITGVPGE